MSAVKATIQSITAGGTSQQVFPAKQGQDRKFLYIGNVSDEDMWISFDTAAAANQSGSMLIEPNSYLAWTGGYAPSNAVNIIGATTGKKFTAYEE